jgi:octaprenyl-diphosphate synthase
MPIDIRLTAAPRMEQDLKKILAPLSEALERVDREIKKRLEFGIPIIDRSAMHLFAGGGKRIRASLVILTSGLKTRSPEGIIELAAATEIIHAASLIHDDIIDQSLFRRGNITVPQKWGNKVAVLVGDFMYSIALNIAIQDGNIALFPLMVSGTKDMIMGELFQLQYSDIESIKKEHYLSIVELKTARFMGTCARLGGTKSNLSEVDCKDLYDFGLNLGFAFQIIDDTLDILHNPSQIGKDAGSDLKDGKITLPILNLIEQGGSEDLDRLKNYSEKPDAAEWEKIKNRLIESGAIAQSIHFAGTFIDKARDILNKFPDSPFRKILFELSDFLRSRKY